MFSFSLSDKSSHERSIVAPVSSSNLILEESSMPLIFKSSAVKSFGVSS
nr:MAG TPA: hypothetical protein [Bacteriophage sp.]